MIRDCRAQDFAAILEVINDGAQAYKGVIPADRWHEPYMSADELAAEIAAGVAFRGYEGDGRLLGVMGVQDVQDVTLIRHAYVRTTHRRQGLGSRLLDDLTAATRRPILIGTWAAATWAIEFYRKHGFEVVPAAQIPVLLKRYWTIPERQIETSVVLAQRAWLAGR